jgi:hypothetical protein
MKIAVIQMSTLDYAEPLKPCMHFNSIYCEKHGYTHICTTPPLPDLHAGFQKPYALLKQIHRFDYVMWVDIDASFVNPEIKLEDIINSDTDRDVWYADDPGDHILNSGVLIFKNSMKGIDLLWKWWEKCNTTEKWIRGQTGDQMRLTTILYPDEGQEELDIFNRSKLEERAMNSYPANYRNGDFVIHFMGYDLEDAGPHMGFLVQNYMQSLQDCTPENLNYIGKYLETLGGMLPSALDRESGDSREIKTEDVQKRMLL